MSWVEQACYEGLRTSGGQVGRQNLSHEVSRKILEEEKRLESGERETALVSTACHNLC